MRKGFDGLSGLVSNALQIEDLKFQLENLKRMVFGAKSERYISNIAPPDQLSLFGQIEQPIEAPATTHVPAHDRKNRKRKEKPARLVLPEHLEREEQVIEPDVDTTDMIKIGEQRTETLAYSPAKLTVKVIVRPKYAPPTTDQDHPESKPSFLTKALMTFVFKALPYPDEPVAAPDPVDQVAYGRYLAVAKFDCYACHSESFTTQNIMEPEKTPGFFGGGNPIMGFHGEIVVSSNLTMDKKTGLGSWTEGQFIRALKTGVIPEGGTYRSPMKPYAAITDDEASAIWVYLQSIPVLHNPKAVRKSDADSG